MTFHAAESKPIRTDSSAQPHKIMKKILLILCFLLTAGAMLACPPDDPPTKGGGEGSGKPTSQKPVK
jgi:hypothetical protein